MKMPKNEAPPSALKKAATSVGATIGKIAASIGLKRSEPPPKTVASPKQAKKAGKRAKKSRSGARKKS
jgi:hypothetical protein